MGKMPTHAWFDAVSLLGWEGTLLNDVDLLGERVAVMARRWTDAGGSRVSLSGVIAHRATWKAGMQAASRFAAFAPRAVLVTGRGGSSDYLRAVAAHTGVGVIIVVGSELDVACWPAPVTPRRRTIAHELVESSVHACLTAHSAAAIH